MTRPDEDGAPRPPSSPSDSGQTRRWSRRHVLAFGLGGAAAVVVAGVAGIELVSHGVLPGQQELDQLDGACSVAAPPLRYSGLGETRNGSFFSQARRREVGYTIAWPPGHGPGSSLPLVVMLHGFGANHTNALTAMSPAQAVALELGGRALPPIAMVTADGGGGYWHPHPDDDPMGMIVSELIPMCRQLNLGRGPRAIGTMGISMGGYGALILAEKYPDTFAAVAAISPAVWTTYAQAQAANQGAYTSAADFAAYDAVTHASALADTPVRLASATDDPFHPGVIALAAELPRTATVDFSHGCHTGPFFTAQEPPSLEFLAAHLSAS
jgi:enterochelin esterase-like enzyme